jgi:hypothetical protein
MESACLFGNAIALFREDGMMYGTPLRIWSVAVDGASRRNKHLSPSCPDCHEVRKCKQTYPALGIKPETGACCFSFLTFAKLRESVKNS